MEKIIQKTTLRYRVWRFTHWWREGNDYALRQTNSCRFFWRLVLMPIPATLLWTLWEALRIAVWVVVSIFSVASARGIFTPRFGRWVEFPEVLLLKTRRRRFTLQGILEWAMISVVLVGVVGVLMTTLSEVSWGGFWEGLGGFLLSVFMVLVIIGVVWCITRLYEMVANWVRRQKEKVCHVIMFE